MDPNYDPGQSWWQKVIKDISNWWNGIPSWQKVAIGGIFVASSVALCFATAGMSAGVPLLGSATAGSALSAAAATALIELSIGIGFAVAGWALNSALTGNWDTNALGNDVADAVFFTGVFMFISSSVNAIKYVYRADPYPLPKLARRQGENIVGTKHNTIKPTQDYVNKTTVDDYVLQIQNGKSLLPIQVSNTNKGLYILDGHHRYVASRITNTRIEVIVFDGGPIGYPDWTYVRWG